jgi:cytochrome P450
MTALEDDSSEAEAPALAISRGCPFDPPAQHTHLRERAPVTRVRLPKGDVVWAVSRNADVHQLLTDERFSNDRSQPGFPSFTRAPEMPPMLSSTDAPDHAPMRRAVLGEFTAKRIATLRPRLQQIVDEHVDAMLAGPRPVDLVRALSLPVPSLAICELLGVQYGDREFFQERSEMLTRVTTPMDDRIQAGAELFGFLDTLVASKEANPSDDLLGRQIIKQRSDGGEADHPALVSLAFELLLGGHETTANMISLGTLALMERPDDVATMLADTATIPAVVDELLRYFAIAEFATSRVAKQDAEFAGQLIRAGEGVIVLGNAANRDPDTFSDPEQLDVHRNARQHITFGYGPHLCIGQHLARVELEIVFETLFRRIPGLTLDGELTQLEFKDGEPVYGVREMPVTWLA